MNFQSVLKLRVWRGEAGAGTGARVKKVTRVTKVTRVARVDAWRATAMGAARG
jgi:hypothetical protein